MCQIAHALGHALCHGHILSVSGNIALGPRPARALTVANARGLSCDHAALLLELGEHTLKPCLHLSAAVPQVPLVKLHHHLGCGLAAGGVHCTTLVHHHTLPAQAALLQAPQDQQPAVGVDSKRPFAGPNRAAVDVDDVEIGPAAVIGVDFVQSQRARGGRDVGLQPSNGALLRLVQYTGNGSEADTTAQQFTQGGLDATFGGVVDPQRQDVTSASSGNEGQGVGRKVRQQDLASLVAPGVEGRAGNVMLSAELGHDAIISVMGEQESCPLCSLVGRARMRLTHWVLPGWLVVVGTSTIPPGSDCVCGCSQTVTLVRHI